MDVESTMLSEEIRKEIRPRLEAVFHDRFRGALLFGSEARGQAEEDSDVDIMVLLREPVELGKDLERIVEALYPLQLQVDRPSTRSQYPPKPSEPDDGTSTA